MRKDGQIKEYSDRGTPWQQINERYLPSDSNEYMVLLQPYSDLTKL